MEDLNPILGIWLDPLKVGGDPTPLSPEVDVMI